MNYKQRALDIAEDVEKYNLDCEQQISLAKVYAILDLADAIRNKNK